MAKILFPFNIDSKNYHTDYEVIIHYSKNKWIKVKIKKMGFRKKIQFLNKNFVETQWIGIIPTGSSFAIGLKDKTNNYEHWDNNQGQNYFADYNSHHIVIYSDIIRYPFMDFNYNNRVSFYIIPFYEWCFMKFR